MHLGRPESFERYFRDLTRGAEIMDVNVSDAEKVIEGLKKLQAAYNVKLLRAFEFEDCYRHWLDYEKGQALWEYDKPLDHKDWHMMRHGIMIRRDTPGQKKESTFIEYHTDVDTRNEHHVPYQKGDYTRHPEGMIYKNGSTISLNGESTVYSHPNEDFSFDYHPWGFVVHDGKSLSLNGKVPLHDGLNGDEDFKVNENGVVVRTSMNIDDRVCYKYLRNGGALQTTHFADERHDLWFATGRGVVTAQNNPNGGFDFLMNRTKFAHRENMERIKPHAFGVVFLEQNGRDQRLLLNGEDVLYEGRLESYHPYKDGVVVHQKSPGSKKRYEFVFYN